MPLPAGMVAVLLEAAKVTGVSGSLADYASLFFTVVDHVKAQEGAEVQLPRVSLSPSRPHHSRHPPGGRRRRSHQDSPAAIARPSRHHRGPRGGPTSRTRKPVRSEHSQQHDHFLRRRERRGRVRRQRVLRNKRNGRPGRAAPRAPDGHPGFSPLRWATRLRWSSAVRPSRRVRAATLLSAKGIVRRDLLRILPLLVRLPRNGESALQHLRGFHFVDTHFAARAGRVREAEIERRFNDFLISF